MATDNPSWGYTRIRPDYFTIEAWTVRGLVTFYTVFVIELQSRRVHVLGHGEQVYMVASSRCPAGRRAAHRTAKLDVLGRRSLCPRIRLLGFASQRSRSGRYDAPSPVATSQSTRMTR